MPTDYLLDGDKDLRIENGDFVKGESTLQHIDLMLRLEKGELRQYPKTGIGINTYLLNDAAGEAYQEIQKQLEADGMKVRKIQIFEDGSINIDAFFP
jgi:hypothetical protein